MKKFLEHPLTNIFISLVIIVSLALLLIHKTLNFTVENDKLLNLIDEIFLIFFSLEFILKMIFLGKKYFFKNLGWIDLIAAIPVFTPLIIYFILKYNSDALLANEALSITIIFRGFKFIRFLRILRTTRLLKFFKNFKKSKVQETKEEPQFPIAIPVVFSILLLIGSYIFTTSIESILKTQRVQQMEAISDTLTKNNIDLILKTNPNILLINKDFVFKRSLSDKEITKNFHTSELERIKKEGSFLLYSVQDITNLTNKIESIMIIIIVIFLIYAFLQFNADVSKMKK